MDDKRAELEELQRHMSAVTALLRASGPLPPKIEEALEFVELGVRAMVLGDELIESDWPEDDRMNEVERRLPRLLDSPSWQKMRTKWDAGAYR